ncbi:MAG: two-component regulator propeller domain-containing protein [Candidatus Promineifilaceae bacterium]|nr:two-component regulator propeller domain-containing protein [Candidatus Promineifilaceae bacterium]
MHRAWNYFTVVLIFSFLLIHSRPNAALAQDDGVSIGSQPITFERLTTDHGLAHNWIRGGIVQDSRGFVWIATNNGLSRFDGYQFKNFYPQPENPNSLSSGSIRAMAIDPDGLIWLATDGGLNKFDPTAETVTRYQHNPADPAGLSDNDLREILIGSNGVIWIGTAGGGLNRFDPISETFTNYLPDDTLPDSLGDTRVSALFEDSAGMLWVGTHRGGLQWLDPVTESFTTFRHNPTDATSISDNKITTIFEDRAGILWVGTSSGLNRFNPTSETFTLIEPESNPRSPLSGGNIQTVVAVQADPGWLWVGTSNDGLYKYKPATNVAVGYQHNPLTLTSLSDNNVINVFTDDSGVIWVATRNGLNKFAPFSQQFPYYTRQPDEANTLSDDLVQVIYQGDDAQIWLGTNAGGLNRLDPAAGRYTHYRHDPADSNSPLSDDIEGITPGAPGTLWLGYDTDGLTKFDIATETFSHYRPESANGDSIPAGYIQDSLLYDVTGEGLWLGLDGGGLVYFDPEAERFTAYRHEPDNLRTLSSNRIKHVFQDQNGAIWAGTDRPELNRLNPSTGLVSRFVYETNEVDRRITILHETADGLMWVSVGRNLLKFDPASGQFFEDEETAPWVGQGISALSVDGQGNFWLGGNSVLNRYDPQSGSIAHFDERDGFISCCSGWFLNPGTGQFFTSGPQARGFHIFNINHIQPRIYQPPVVLTNFHLFGRPVPIGGDSPLQQDISATDTLTLANDDNFAFEFAALDYADPDSVQYRYRLDGFEDNWNNVGPQRRYAAYTSLPAGDYTFLVQATNSQNRWGEREVAVPLTIVPYWWQTRWFQVLVAAFIVALIYGGYRWRLWQVDRRNRLLEQQVAERTLDLVDSEARFRGLSTSTFEAVVIHEQGQILDVNQVTIDMYGYSREELIGKQAIELTAPESRQLVAQQIQTASEDVYELIGLTKDGRHIPLEVRAKMIPYQGRQVRVVAIRDLTERRQIESHKQQLAVLEERERIGRELHDDLGQVMSYVSVQTQAALSRLDDGEADETRAILTQVAEVAQDAHAGVRQHILGIRESGDEKPGTQSAPEFTRALTHYLEVLEERYGLQTNVSLPDDWQDSFLAPEVEMQLLRIIQEALTNVRKHAGVLNARLLLTTHIDEIQVVIEDEGNGFELPSSQPVSDNTYDEKGERHFGLEIMRERAESVGGSVAVQSAPGEGTRLIVRLPRSLEPASGTLRMEGVRVLVADDHPLYLEGLHSLLASRGLHVVGVAHDGLEVQDLARELRPDLILMDVHMPGCDGVEATKAIMSELVEVKIIMLTVADDSDLLFRALKSGASGYLLKSLDSRTFFNLLSQALAGQTVLSPSMAGRILTEFAQEDGEPDTAPEEAVALTARQREVLELVAQGMSNSEIASQLYVSQTTVKYHVSQILSRLHLRSRYQLAQYVQNQSQIQ